MSKAEERVAKLIIPKQVDDVEELCIFYYIKGYHQAEKDVAGAFARIIRGNLSMIDKSVQDKFEQLYTDITGEKMYKGFKD